MVTTDARLSDARTPTAHTHTLADVTDYTAPDLSGYVTTSDARLSDARTPLAHTHAIADTTGLQSALDGKAATGHTHAELHTHANAAALALVSGTNTGDEPDATTTTAGIVELATTAEATAGTDTSRAVTPAGVAAAIDAAGSGVDAEGVQDVVGAMVAAAGGTYDDAAGSITLPTGGGGTVGTSDATLPRALSLATAKLATADVAPFTILFLGDSLTWSGSAWVDKFVARLGLATGATTSVLKSRGQADVAVPAIGIYGVNCASDGASSLNYVTNNNAVAMATAAQPALVVHGIGTNNILGTGPVQNFEDSVRGGIAAIDGACTLPPVHLLWWFGSIYGRLNTDGYVAKLVEIAADYPGRVAMIDLGPYADTLKINDNISGTGDPYGLDGGDGIHLSASGLKMLGELMARALLAAPAIGVVGWSAAEPTSGTTTTTTTSAATTTTTTAAGTTTTTTTAAAGTTFAYLTSDTHTTSQTTHTFAGLDLGVENAARTIVVAVQAGGQYVSSVTLNGAAVTMDVEHRGSSASIAWIGRVAVPTGTTGTVVVTMTGSTDRVSVGLWSILGAHTLSATDTTNAVQLAATAGDFCVFSTTGGTAWTGDTVTARYTVTMGSGWGANGADRIATGSTSISATGAVAIAGAAYRAA